MLLLALLLVAALVHQSAAFPFLWTKKFAHGVCDSQPGRRLAPHGPPVPSRCAHSMRTALQMLP